MVRVTTTVEIFPKLVFQDFLLLVFTSFSAFQMMLGHSSTHLPLSTGSSRSGTPDSSQGCTMYHYLHKVGVNGLQLSHSQILNVPAISHHILGMLSIQPGNLTQFSTSQLRFISTHISDITTFSCFVTRLHYSRLRGKGIRTIWHERDNVEFELINIPLIDLYCLISQFRLGANTSCKNSKNLDSLPTCASDLKADVVLIS
jgi:hypothetical protein